MNRIIRCSMLLVGALLPITSGATQSLDGVWRSQGYGYVFDIQEPALKAFEVTTLTCVASFTAKRTTIAGPGREATFKTKDGMVLFVRADGANDHKLLHTDGSASDIRIDRLPRIPPVCDQLTADNPLDNFEVFTRTWAEHYISFDLKQTDWDKVVANNRPKFYIPDYGGPAVRGLRDNDQAFRRRPHRH